MRAGNREYKSTRDFPETVPVFPLSGALLLPGGNMPLNIFESRYLEMTDYALATNRLIGMIQPELGRSHSYDDTALCSIGCIGRLTGFQETGDGRYMINLSGVCRFELLKERETGHAFRMAEIKVNESDLQDTNSRAMAGREIDRELLLDTFRRYLEANNMETDWDAVERTDDETLVTALCMMSPYGPAEKQALLEAPDLHTRAETLVALTEMALARNTDDPENLLQ